MKLASDTILFIIPNFMDFGLWYADTTDELEYVFAFTTIIGWATCGSNWIPRSHCINETTADIVNETNSKNHYNLKS